MYANKILQRFYTINDTEVNPDQIRGCLFGGAAGNALGYNVVFLDEEGIKKQYGEKGITEYQISREGGKALISDDTQMTLFTANGLLVADTKAKTEMWELMVSHANYADVVLVPGMHFAKKLQRYGMIKPTIHLSNGVDDALMKVKLKPRKLEKILKKN